MQRKYLYLLSGFMMLQGFAVFVRQEWKINNNFNLRFSDRFADGVFENLKGSVVFDTADLGNSGFDVSVEVSSINTGNKLKNKHAQGPQWFDAEKHPLIRYVSDSIYRRDSMYVAVGNLEIKGISKKTEIPFTFSSAGDSAIFSSAFSINRSEFGIRKSRGDKRDSTYLIITVPAVRKKVIDP